MGGVRVYVREGCPSCSRVLLALERSGAQFYEVDIVQHPQQWEKLRMMCDGLEVSDLPQVFFGFQHIGGVKEVLDLEASGRLVEEITAALADDTSFDLSHISSKLGSESKQTTTELSADVSISVSEFDEGAFDVSEDDEFVQMRIKEAVMNWSGAVDGDDTSISEDDVSSASDDAIPPPTDTGRASRRTRTPSGSSVRLTPVVAVRAVVRAVGALQSGSASESDARVRNGNENEADADNREIPVRREGRVQSPPTERKSTGTAQEDLGVREATSVASETKLEPPERFPQPLENRNDVASNGRGDEGSEKRYRIKNAVMSWTGSNEMEPEERIEHAFKLWRGEEDQKNSAMRRTQSLSKGLTRSIRPIHSNRSLSDADAWDLGRRMRYYGVLGFWDPVRSRAREAVRGEKWEQCWFVLYDSELLCFHSQKDQKKEAFPMHTWFLRCAQVSVPVETSNHQEMNWGHSHVFKLRIVMGKVLSEYFFSSKSQKALDRWILELNDAIEHCWTSSVNCLTTVTVSDTHASPMEESADAESNPNEPREI